MPRSLEKWVSLGSRRCGCAHRSGSSSCRIIEISRRTGCPIHDSELRLRLRTAAKTALLPLMFCFMPAIACAQSSTDDWPATKLTQIQSAPPSKKAQIVRYHVAKSPSSSDFETGDLYIVYSDGTEVVEKIAPQARERTGSIVHSQRGIINPKVAENRRTIGWAETFDSCCTTYPIPEVLTIYQSGKTVLRIQQGQMLWYWMFLKQGRQIAAVWGTTHGPQVGDFQLYDVQSGKMIAEVSGDVETQSLNSQAPEWAKQVEQEMHQRR
jgi:hypothetical protein